MDEATLERLADLVVGFGANVQRDQIVSVSCEPGKEPLTRAIAASAYRHGAKFVDVAWFDPWIKRARIAHAREETLEFVPDWYGARVLALGDQRAARIGLSGPSAPGVLDGLDPVRAGKDRLPALKESGKVVNDRTTNWSIVPCSTPVWAALVFEDLPPEEAQAALDERLLHVLRLDEPDPIAPGRAVGRGALRDRRRDRAHAEPPDRGGLHHAGPGTPRGARHVEQAARPRRRDGGARAARALRGRPGGPDRRRHGPGHDAHDRVAQRGRGPARRGRPGGPRGPDRQARPRVLRHADRRERGEPHRPRPGLSVPAPGGVARPREREPDPH